MRAIFEPRISIKENKFAADCVCGRTVLFTTKDAALKLLNRGYCRNCTKRYISVRRNDIDIYKREDGVWCSTCSGCGCEQTYTRKEHAKQSTISDWQCKKCVGASMVLSNNKRVGDKKRLYNKFRKTAYARELEWNITEEEMFANYNGYCALTGWPISMEYSNSTASLDRIDNTAGYFPENIQWVYSMVNMCKNKFPNEKFIEMCIAISENQKKIANKTKW